MNLHPVMTREHVLVGMRLQVVIARWDVPAGTLARIESVGSAGDQWCFTVEWLTRASPFRRLYSLNLFEEDLSNFAVYEGPTPSMPSVARASRTRQVADQARLRQLLLPFPEEACES